MEILVSIIVGLTVGGVATTWRRCPNGPTGGITVGVLGALFGTAAGAWIGNFSQRALLDAAVAAAIGSGILLLLWIVAQRLFVCPPAETIQQR